MSHRSTLVGLSCAGLIAVAASTARPLHAQCPDGSAPPCRGSRPAAAPVRAVVPMDDRTWIVLPFDNQARAQDIAWLTDASVNLLSMDLSRWSDVRAVDDKRVADFLREVPSARPNQKLSLRDGLGVARRAGAGKLVMGEFLKIGSRIVVSATAYNARNGSVIRPVRRETTVIDSLMPLFGKVASDLLGVPPPVGANVGTVGTSRADAYQEYLAGVSALNRFDIPQAKQRFEAALKLDTAFALAHYKLAITRVYDEASQAEQMVSQASQGNQAALLGGIVDSVRLAHAAAAAGLSAPLPQRERALINGLLAHTKRDYARACELYGSVVRADSNDVEALFGLGACLYHDDHVEYAAGDTTQPRFRTSWNTALRVLRRALAVDPNYHLAFDPVLNVLGASGRIGCHRDDPAQPCATTAQRFRAVLRRQGDSLVTRPIPATVGEAIVAQVSEAHRNPARRANLEEARRAAEEWVTAGPREGRALKTLGRILLRLGRLEEADRTFADAAPLLPPDAYSEIPYYRLEIALKLGRTVAVHQLFDSISAAAKSEFLRHSSAMIMGPVVGETIRADSALGFILGLQGNASRLPPVLRAHFAMGSRIAMGVAGDSALALENLVLRQVRSETTCSQICQVLLAPNYLLGLRLSRAKFPAFDSTAKDRRWAPAVALGASDTSRLRAAAMMLDSATREDARLGLPEDGASAVAADAFLLLRDTVSALRVVRRALDTTMVMAPLESPVAGAGIIFFGSLWPRMMLVRADLEAAKGDKQEALKWYKRFLELWEHANPELQPVVDRARSAYAALGGR